jgi:hypothetical protein
MEWSGRAPIGAHPGRRGAPGDGRGAEDLGAEPADEKKLIAENVYAHVNRA